MTEKVILLDYLRQKTNDAELFRKLLYRSLGFKPKRAGETLSENPNPQLNNLNTILQAMGYSLMAQKLPSATA